jgi:RHS repeat-associated protein
VGGTLVSPSGTYKAQLLSGGRIEILSRGNAVWISSAATGLKGVVVRLSNGAIKIDDAARSSHQTVTSPGPSYLTIENDGDLALISTTGVPVWQGGVRANVTGSPVAPYSPGALFGTTNPSVLCYTCDAANVTGSAPPSDTLDSGTGVNNLTGDFSTSNTLFDAKAVGGDLALSLGYDAQLAQLQLTNGTSGLHFGEGWSSNFSTSVTPGTDGSNATVTVNQASGAQVTFTASADGGVSTSCQSSGDPAGNQYPGDYPFTAKYTLSTSTYNFCALDSVQGQLSEIPGTGFTYQQHGGEAIQNYGWTGQLESSTTAAASSGTPALGLVYYSASAGTMTVAGVTLVNACPSTATYGCTIIYTNDGRDIVEELNSTGQVTQVIDPSGASYGLTYSSNNLTSVSEPSPTGSGAATWTYVYSSASSPYSSDLVQIYDPDAVLPSGLSSGALHSSTITYGSGTYAGMVASLVDGSGSSATTSYSYASACATGQCATAGSTQTTTITYPGECPSSAAGCATTSPSTVTADIPREIDQYSNGLETSTQLGSQTTASESETWLYNWVLGNGVANTSETITYPNTLIAAGSSPTTRTASIVTDPAGNIVSTTNALGDVATSAYNESTSLNLPELAWSFPGPSSNSSSSSPAGSSSYTYNSFGQVVTATDPLGTTTFYGYYSHYSLLCYRVKPMNAANLGWTSSSTPPSCSSSSTTYDSGAISAPVGSTTYSYDVPGDVVASTIDAGDTSANADVQTTTASYNAMGNVLWSIPPAGQSGAQSSSNPYATSTSYVTGTSLPSSFNQPDGITTLSTYDAAGNTTSTGNQGVSSLWVYSTSVYDGDNRACYQLRGSGSFGSSCTAAAAAGATITTYVPGSTAVLTVTDANSHTTSYYYDDLAYPNSVTEVADAAGSQTQYSAYDDYGNACVTGDAAATLGSTQCTAPPSGDTAMTFDPLGNETSITDPSGNVTTNYFENSSYPTLLTRSVNALGAMTKYLYDANGNLVTTLNPDGTGVTSNYNANGLVCNMMPTLVAYPCGQGPSVAGVTQYLYNDANEPLSMSDNTANPATPTIWSQTSSYGYSTGQLTSTTDGNGLTVNYAYNDAGQVSCTGYPVSTTTNCSSPASLSNTIVTKAYDPLGRLSSTTDWLGNSVNYTYGYSASPGTPTAITDATSTPTTVVTANYGLDNVGNVTSLGATSLSSPSIADAWTYNADEQVATSALNGSPSGTTTYNANQQITQATNPGTSTSNDTYTVALNGEVTNDAPPVGPAVASTYNAGGELCNTASSAVACGSTPSSGTAYTFSTNGQRASSTPSTGGTAGTTTNYNWNPYGELCSVGQSSGISPSACGALPSGGTSYQYNGEGLRTSATTASSATDSTWDTVSGSIPLNLNDATTTGSATSTTSYVYGDLLFGGTAPTEQITTTSSGTTVSFLVANQTGVQGVYSANAGSLGSVQEMALYSLYGNQTISTGSRVTPFGFQGSYVDSTGLIYLVNRYYDPSTDQFISMDPAVQSTDQPYVFTNDNPLNSEDPLGLCALKPGGGCYVVTAPKPKPKPVVISAPPSIAVILAQKLETESNATGTISAAGSTVLVVGALGLPEDLPGEAVVATVASSAGDASAGSELSACILDPNLSSCTSKNLTLDVVTLASPPIFNLLPNDIRRYAQVSSYVVDIFHWFKGI